MTKQDIINASKEIKSILFYKNPTEEQIDKLSILLKKFGHIPAIDKIMKENYDNRALHPGFGAPDCYCHIMPPCDNCIRFTNDGELV